MKYLYLIITLTLIFFACEKRELNNPADPDSENFNQPPYFTLEISDILDSILYNHKYCDTIPAKDPEKKPLVFSFIDSAREMELIDDIITWTPSELQIGSNEISLMVTDGEASDTINWKIHVYNSPPHFITTPDSLADSIRANSEYKDTLFAYDSNLTNIYFDTASVPNGFNISDSVFTWIPSSSDTGEHTIKLYVLDSLDEKDSLEWTVTVWDTVVPSITNIILANNDFALNPDFNKGVFSYSATVPNTRSSIIVTPFSNVDTDYNIFVNDQNVQSSNNSNPIGLNIGNNDVFVRLVSSKPETLATYTIQIQRLAPSQSDNSKLLLLSLSENSLSPQFDSSITEYSSSFHYSDSTVVLNIQPINEAANILVSANSDNVNINQHVTDIIDLDVGQNNIVVSVESEDKTDTTEYTVTITRSQQSTADDNADLFSINLSSGSLSPAFSNSVYQYDVEVENSISSIDITPVLDDPGASLKFNQADHSDNTPYTMNLNVGSNSATIIVTAKDNETQNAYILNIVRKEDTDASLKILTVKNVQLNPAFSNSVTEYTVTLEQGTDSVIVSAAPTSLNASFKIEGNPAIRSEDYTIRNLSEGEIINILVTAQDNTTQTEYKITVNYLQDNEARLSSVTVTENNNTVDIGFHADTMTYDISVPFSTDSIIINALAMDQDNAVIEYAGQNFISGDDITDSLQVGSNVIELIVTAEDGTTQKTYTFNIQRQEPSDNANLLSIDIFDTDSDQQLIYTPSFNKDTVDYTIQLTQNMQEAAVFVIAEDTTSDIIVNSGDTISSGQSDTIGVSLSGGATSIVIDVISQSNDSTKQYEITIFPPPASDATLSDLLVDGYDINFSASTTEYTINLATGVDSITITPFANDDNASILINGETVQSNSSIKVGVLTDQESQIVIEVKAEDNITKNFYYINTVPPSDNDYLSDLMLEGYSINFDSTISNYTIDLIPGSTSVSVTPVASHDSSSITIDNDPVTSGSLKEVSINGDQSQDINIEVTAQNGQNTRIYKLTVIPPSSNMYLSGLTIDGYTIAFDSSQTQYNIDLDPQTSSIIVTPNLSDINATMTVGGTPSQSGNPVDVSVSQTQATSVDIVVTAEDLITQNTYTINAIPPSNDSTLSNLQIEGYTINFDPETENYQITLKPESTSVAITATLSDVSGSLTIDGGQATSGFAKNVTTSLTTTTDIDIVVTAENQISTKTYTLSVVPLATDANLSDLSVASYNLNPAFESVALDYQISRTSYNVNSLGITATLSDQQASLTIDGSSATSGIEKTVSNIKEYEPDTVEVEVTAEDQATTKIYRVFVQAPPYDTVLSSINFSSGTLTPTFDVATTNYTLDISGTNIVMLTPSIQYPNSARIIVNADPWNDPDTLDSGTQSGDITIDVGVTNITVEVEPLNSEASSRIYNFSVKKAGWILCGSSSTFSEGAVNNIDLAIDKDNGNIFVAYGDSGYTSNKANPAVKYFDSNSESWVDAGSLPISTDHHTALELAYDYSDKKMNLSAYNSDGRTLKYYTFGGGSWGNHSTIISGGSFSCNSMDLVVGYPSIPIIAYEDPTASGKLTVRRFELGSWNVLDNVGITSSSISDITVKKTSSRIYISYIFNNGGERPMAITYDEVGMRWEDLMGNQGIDYAYVEDESSKAQNILLNSSGHVFDFYIDNSNDEINCYEFYNNSWQRFSSSIPTQPNSDVVSAVNSNNDIFVAFTTETSGNIYVYKYNGSSWQLVGNSYTGYNVDVYQSNKMLSMVIDQDTDDIYIGFRNGSKGGKISVIKWFE